MTDLHDAIRDQNNRIRRASEEATLSSVRVDIGDHCRGILALVEVARPGLSDLPNHLLEAVHRLIRASQEIAFSTPFCGSLRSENAATSANGHLQMSHDIVRPLTERQ